jgi:phospholipase C
MSFQLHHHLVARSFRPVLTKSGTESFFKVSEKGDFKVLFPGQLKRRVSATFVEERNVDPVVPEPVEGQPVVVPLHGGIQSLQHSIPLKLRIFTPDDQEFTANEITLADLKKFRDPRGRPKGSWSYTLTGESSRVALDDEDSIGIKDAKGGLGLGLLETVASESARPLVNKVKLTATRQSFQFDLFRVGTFVAEISLQSGAQWRGSMRLIDPDGVSVASTTGKKLTFAVGLRTLNKSRDAAGKVRRWILEVAPQGGVVVGSPHLSATVIGSGRITIEAINSRIEALLGKHGEFIKVFGDNKDGEALGRLKITDVVSAETIDMHGLLDDVLEGIPQDGNADPGAIHADTVYTVARRSEDLGHDLKLDVDSLKVATIDFVIGPGNKLGATVPAVKLTVAVSGAAKVTFHGATLATAKVRGGAFEMEVGIKLDSDGTPKVVTAVPDSPFDIEFITAVKAALLATLGLGGLIAGFSVTDFVEDKINKGFVAGLRDLFSNPTLAPTILMTIFGAHLTYKPFRFEDGELVFDHIAPVEPEPKPTPDYQGAIGRSFNQLTAGKVSFIPPRLANTWAADNLNKIDHIVVVMMENRSYDHVLGYRARVDINDGADGLTEAMIQAIEAAPNGPFNVRNFREASFAKNAVNLMTQLPKGVGHELDDVAEQLSVRTAGPNNRQINSPKGFVENFKPRLKTNPMGVIPDDVLGFYDEKDLLFYKYLAENYAYCDRYFCSHPGPTLPNRMYSLSGDLAHDRFGVPILENNNGDNFLLSRAPTIYDFLVRKGLSFRVYESFPSATMLRMFARYATDTTNIVPLQRLAADVKRGDLPAFTAIEPAMHHHPQNDDHPDADMHRGQIFVRDVYKILRSNAALWQKTLLIITYDEHGGLYDHVVPPIADVLHTSGSPVLDSNPDGPPTPGTAPSTMLAIPYGVRVPTFVVSPFTTRGKGPSLILDHCSILKSVLARFWGGEKPFLSDRVHASHSFNSFLTEPAPRTVPDFDDTILKGLPITVRNAPSRTTQIITTPLTRKDMRKGSVDFHELSGRWARQLGR